MKINFMFCVFVFGTLTATSQTAITAVTTSTVPAPGSTTYISGPNTYNWGLSPNNSTVFVDGFTATVPYTYASFLTGNVKLRRVDNAFVTGNFSLVWAEVVNGVNTFNMFPAYQNDMEPFFNNRTYNKGTDNFMDNTSANSNNIERLDWILNSSFSTSTPALIGFAIFERGNPGAHDPFCIAAITSLDGLGNPATYSNIVRVVAGNYGDPGPNVTYRILKGLVPTDLLDAGTAIQSRGGVIVSLQSLGIAPGTPIFGYSLFSNDLPVGATPADLVDFTNATNFPTNTGNAGGIDLVAVTGIYIANSILPVRFISFNGVENKNDITLQWIVENEISVDRYEIERSKDGIQYQKVSEVKSSSNSAASISYSVIDKAVSVTSTNLYYRIKQYDLDGSYHYSKTIALKRNHKNSAVIIYPNPVRETLQINISSMINHTALISVFNSTGSQVIQQQEKLGIGNNSFTIDGVDKLSKGVYILSIRYNSGKTETKQFSKQ